MLMQNKGGGFMPLAMVSSGEIKKIQQIHGKDEVKRFLESLGFVVGSDITVVAEMGGNLIVNIKDTRVAISRSMANKIMVA